MKVAGDEFMDRHKLNSLPISRIESVHPFEMAKIAAASSGLKGAR